jgi:type IV pilus assembly protein PilX
VLTLVIALTLLALAAGFSSLQEEKLSRVYRDRSLAFQSAEGAIRRVQQQQLDLLARSPLV